MNHTCDGSFMTQTRDGTLLAVKVVPGARAERIGPVAGGRLRVAVTAAPEKGKANRELVKLLAGRLGVRKSDISIERGETAREKLVLLRGVTPGTACERLRVD